MNAFTIFLFLSIFFIKVEAYGMSLPFDDKLQGIKEKAEETYNYLREKSPAVKIYNAWIEQKAKTKEAIEEAYDNMATIYSQNEYDKAIKSNEIAYKYAREKFYKKAIYHAIKSEKYAKLAKNKSVERRSQFKELYKPKLDFIQKNLLCMDKNIPKKEKNERKNYNDYVLSYSKYLNLYRTDQFEGLNEEIENLTNKIMESRFKCAEEEEKK